MFHRMAILALFLFIPIHSLPDKSSIEMKKSPNLSYGMRFPQPASLEPVREKISGEVKTKTLSIKEEIDLLRIERIASKGRMQDRQYNFQNQEIIEKLIKYGKASIPFLIEKLDDKSKLPGHVIDYWSEVTVADIAMILLTDLFTDSSWEKTTIPEAQWTYIIGDDEKSGFFERRTRFIERYGRKSIKNKWEKTWKKYQNRIYWDEKERCFNIK
jgi:hypothetical protein